MTKEPKKPLTKSEIQSQIAESTGLTRKQVALVLDSLGKIISTSVSPKGAGSLVLLGLLKIEKKEVPGRPARRAMNPFTKEMQDYPAKPKSCKIKIRPLKSLKDML